MGEIMIPTIEELTRRRMESLTVSEKAVAEHPEEYRKIKKLVRNVLGRPLDIDDYYRTAEKLAGLLCKMTESGTRSVFCYFYTNIDPHQKGEARYFRANCMDLCQQLKCVDRLRCGRRHLRLVRQVTSHHD